MLSFLDPRVLGRSDDTLERHPRSSFTGVHTWHLPIGQFSTLETGLLDIPGSSP